MSTMGAKRTLSECLKTPKEGRSLRSASPLKADIASVLFEANLGRSFLNFLSDQIDDASGSYVSVW